MLSNSESVCTTCSGGNNSISEMDFGKHPGNHFQQHAYAAKDILLSNSESVCTTCSGGNNSISEMDFGKHPGNHFQQHAYAAKDILPTETC